MKATVIVVFAAFLAVAAATVMPDEEVFGNCPEVDGPKPVYLMDKWYRSVFYECSNGRPIRQNCSVGLVFDPRMNVCTLPNIDCQPYGPVGTCPRYDGKEYPLTFLRDGANMAVYYYCWASDIPKMGRCQGDMYFNMFEEKCLPFP